MEKEDIGLFLRMYNNLRKRNLLAYSLHTDSATSQCHRLMNYTYNRIGNLVAFLESWKKETYGPLLGRHLRENGFNDLWVIPEEVGKRISDEHNTPLNHYRINETEEMTMSLLATIVWRVEVCYSLWPQIKNDERLRFIEDNPESQTNLEKEIDGYLYFIKFGRLLKEKLPSVDVHIDDSTFGEFFPTTYIVVNGYPYVMYQQCDIVTCFDDIRCQPIYRITYTLEYMENGVYELHAYRESAISDKKHKSIKILLDKIFELPEDFENKKNEIINAVKNIFHVDTSNSKVFYDWVKECYHLDDITEDTLFESVPITHSAERIFCKYTSLSTLIATLQSGKIRINSIVSMNDPTETEKMKNEGRNFQFYKESVEDLWKNNNFYFIVSFTSKEDDLDMWRFYGDNASGVCLVFEPFDNISPEVFDINYVDFTSKLFCSIDMLFKNLSEKQIRFTLLSYVFNHLLMKPKDFSTENEKRFVAMSQHPNGFAVYSNGIVTPYIARELRMLHGTVLPDDVFPLRLSKIILGPEMANKEINKRQIEFMIKNTLRNYGKIQVALSSISCYRQ